MIKYQLRCENEHQFEGWFRGSADFDAQAEAGRLECPICGSSAVQKAIMAPAIAGTKKARREARLAEIRESMATAARRARDYVEKNFDYVGERFPEEARKIHYGEVKQRGIYGEASGKEVRELVEEGVAVAPLPGTSPKERLAGDPAPAAGADKKPLN